MSRLARISSLPGILDSESTPLASSSWPSKKPPLIVNLGWSLAHLSAIFAGVWGDSFDQITQVGPVMSALSGSIELPLTAILTSEFLRTR